MGRSTRQGGVGEIELDDADFGRVVRVGSLIGIPLTFIIALVISLAGAGWPTAAAIAVWPALVGGPFIGGFVVLMKRMAQLETTAPITHLPVRPAAAPVGHRHAA